MTLKEFHEFKENTFDAFCKIIIRHEAVNCLRELAKRSAHQINFSEMSHQDLSELSQTDEYESDVASFWVRDTCIHILNPLLGQALKFLMPDRREVILLAYFLQLNDQEIADILHITSAGVGYRRTHGIKQLRSYIADLEAKGNEKK